MTRLMRENGLRGKQRRRFRTTTQSNHHWPVAPNTLDRQFAVTRPNVAWVGDITYVWTLEGWLYLCVILDLYSRHSRVDLEAVASALNSRPRKTLGWKTPAEVLDAYLRLPRE